MEGESISLVIDASVLLACGYKKEKNITANQEEKKEKSSSDACREFLETVLKRDYIVAVTSEILDEWDRKGSDKKPSGCSLEWRRAIARKGRLYIVKKSLLEEMQNKFDEILEKINNLEISERRRNAMLEDFLLVKAALATDNRIVSLESEKPTKRGGGVRGCFRLAARSIEELRPIVWVNPAIAAEEAIAWLQQGAPAEAKRQLGHHVSDADGRVKVGDR